MIKRQFLFIPRIFSILLALFFSIQTTAAGTTTTTTGGSQSSWNNKGKSGSSNVYDSSKQAEKGNNIGMVVNLLGAGIMTYAALKICPAAATPAAPAVNAVTGAQVSTETLAAEQSANFMGPAQPIKPSPVDGVAGAGMAMMGCATTVMGVVQSLAQLAENAKKKGEYGGLANQFECPDPKLCSTTPSPDLKPDPDGNFLNNVDFGNANLNAKKNEIKKNLAALKKAGVKIDFNGNKVSLPNGQSFDGSKLKSQSDWDKMFGEGGKKALADANKSLADEMKKYMDGGLDDSSSGFASKSNRNSSADPFGLPTQGSAGASATTQDRLPASTDGLTKLFNGEPVGLSSENIFLQMSRRYKLKEGRQEFLNEQGDE